MGRKIHKTFAHNLKDCSLGYALYHPIEFKQIPLPSLGFFDENGYWHRIDPNTACPPLEPFDGDLTTKTDYPDLRPIIASSELESISVGLDAKLDGSLIGFPATLEASITGMEFKKSAAIICAAPLVRHSIPLGATNIRQWGLRNARAIQRNWPLTKEYGFFIVTATQRTTACALKCWSNSERRGSLKFELSAPVSGNGDVHAKYLKACETIGWNAIEEEFVLFIEGYLFLRRKLGIGTKIITGDALSRGAHGHEAATDTNERRLMTENPQPGPDAVTEDDDDDSSEVFTLDEVFSDGKDIYELECHDWTNFDGGSRDDK